MATIRRPDVTALCQTALDKAGIAATTATDNGEETAPRDARLRAHVTHWLEDSPRKFKVILFVCAFALHYC
jgi:hypothetical protein